MKFNTDFTASTFFAQFNVPISNNSLVKQKLTFTANICNRNTTFTEVLAVLAGSDLTDKSIMVLEGHVDSRNSNICDANGAAPGVSDNATGSALIIEAARVLSKYSFKCTIFFAHH